MNTDAIEELFNVVERLLAPDGCPWDREQTHESLQRYLIEECYETVEAIEEADMGKLKEELGDLLFQIVFHSELAKKAGYFDFMDVVEAVSKKMINRHPHVFGSMDLKTSNEVMNKWEGFKQQEGKKFLLEGIPIILPALMRALKMQEKAAQVGFDWPAVEGAMEKFKEEVDELSSATNDEEIKEEMGDMFFALANIARKMNVDPEAALQSCNDKFARRFNYLEAEIKKRGMEFMDLTIGEMDEIWDEAKKKGY